MANKAYLLNTLKEHAVVNLNQDRYVLSFTPPRRYIDKNYNITSYNQVKEFPTFLISFSQEMMKVIQAIKIFLMNKMYRHKIVNNMTNSANQIISDLFDYYFNNQKEMAIILKDQFYQSLSDFDKADLIADYIAGMTDRFAINNHKTLMFKN
jgi:dGTPase